MSKRIGKKVVILGGGVAGMSAAHELVERGFDVEVFERKAIPGGKARSLPALGPSAGTAPLEAQAASVPGPHARSHHFAPAGQPALRPLPGEHGFRFFPGFYKHIVDTMARIPERSGSVADHLVDTSELLVAPFDRPSYVLPLRFPQTTGDLKVDAFAIIAALAGRVGVSPEDGLFFANKVWRILTSCEERRLIEYERVNWWDFIEADRHSHPYQKYFGDGITRSLVAAKARRASTKTIGDIFIQIVLNVLIPGVAADRLLDGPTNDVWIDPWLTYLRQRGVVYHTHADVRALRCERGVVRSALVALRGHVREVTGDYYVGALPVERMAELVTPELATCDPSLNNLSRLTEYVEWMNGIQFYLREDVPLAHGHAIYVDSPWALTSVSQAQFWKAFPLANYGDGTVKGLLSVDISDWDVRGMNGKEAQRCSRREIAMETWEQLKRSLNAAGEILSDAHLHSWFLDPDIDDMDADRDESTPRIDTNAEPLLVNYVDTWRIRPDAVTRIPNFFLASDYVRTFTDLATMEAANEAARRAVNGVLRAARADVEPCALWNLHEPEVFAPLRAYDRVRYRRGQPWDAQTLDFARAAGVLASRGALARPREIGSSETDSSAPAAPGASRRAHSVEQVARDARASSDAGLRRMRIRGGP